MTRRRPPKPLHRSSLSVIPNFTTSELRSKVQDICRQHRPEAEALLRHFVDDAFNTRERIDKLQQLASRPPSKNGRQDASLRDHIHNKWTLLISRRALTAKGTKADEKGKRDIQPQSRDVADVNANVGRRSYADTAAHAGGIRPRPDGGQRG